MRCKYSCSTTFLKALFSIKAADIKQASALAAEPRNRTQWTEKQHHSDVRLCDVFLDSHIWDILTKYVKERFSQDHLEVREEGDPHFSALRGAIHVLWHENKANASKSSRLYNPTTVLDFHYLLLSLLSMFMWSLDTLTLDNLQGQFRTDAYEVAWLFAFLLWMVAHSCILQEHLALLHNAKLIVVPNNEGVTSATDDTEENSDWDPPATSRQNENIDTTVLQWIHLLVSNVTALDTLSRITQHHPIHVDLVELRPATIKENVPWQPVLRKALCITDMDPEYVNDAIAMMLRHIVKPGVSGERHPDFLKHFQEDRMRVTGVIHCEAALAALISFLPRAISTSENRGLLPTHVCFFFMCLVDVRFDISYRSTPTYVFYKFLNCAAQPAGSFYQSSQKSHLSVFMYVVFMPRSFPVRCPLGCRKI